MAFNEGDFIEIAYTVWNDESNSILATTYEDVAKKEGIYKENVRYGDVLVVIGSNAVVKGLEKELVDMSIGVEKELVLQPEDAFGDRDEKLVKVMKLSDFKSHNITPYPGMLLNIDNTLITIKSVGSGRVVIDANNPDAGKRVRYEVKVSRLLEDKRDKITALAKTFNISPTSVEIDGTGTEIYYDNSIKKDSDYFVNRAKSLNAIFAYLKDIDKVVVKEEYLRGSEKKDDNSKEDTTAEESS